MFNTLAPDSFRVIVDGDIVPSVPYSSAGYKHIGTEILIDPVGAGSIIVDSSFVERRLRNHFKSSVSVHSLNIYRKGLIGVKEAAQYMNEVASLNPDSDIARDPLKLALTAAPLLYPRSSLKSPIADMEIRSPTPSNQDPEIGEAGSSTLKNRGDQVVASNGWTESPTDTHKQTFSNVLGEIAKISRIGTWVHGGRRNKENVSKTIDEDLVPRRLYVAGVANVIKTEPTSIVGDAGGGVRQHAALLSVSDELENADGENPFLSNPGLRRLSSDSAY